MIRLGTVPEWLGAIFTGGAFALGAAVIGIERRRRLRDRVELVSCWAMSWQYAPGGSEPSECVAVVPNASPTPAYECRLELLDWVQ